MVDVSIILPTYNEKESITRVLLSVTKILRQHQIVGEMIVVDDNSPDGTASIVQKFADQNPEVKLIVRTEQYIDLYSRSLIGLI